MERLKDEARNRTPGSNAGAQSAVADVLLRLNDRDREVLMLSYWDDRGRTTDSLGGGRPLHHGF